MNIVILIEHMDYKNIFIRSFISILLISIYLLSLYSKNILFIFVTLLYLIIIYEIYMKFKKYFRYILSYLILSYLSFILFFIQYFNYNLINILVFTIILFDSFSYFIGITYGKNYIFKKISPKKTLEGYIGGFILTNIIFLIYFHFMIINFNLLDLLLLINLIIIISIFGDLIQSFFKRKNNIKDSSKLLPGHGGFFDRFDSFISSIIFVLFYSIF